MNKIYRIFDANINRALEGLRVVEEITRFILEDKKLSTRIKGFRAQVKAVCQTIPRQELLIKIRDSQKDVGWKVYPKSEARRADILSIFKANIKRATEALRVLEEFSKLVDPGIGRAFKDLRFMVYDLEKEVYLAMVDYLKLEKLNFNLYVIIDPRAIGRKNILPFTKKILSAGVKFIQYRDKQAARPVYLKNAQRIHGLARRFGATFIVNDYVEIARQIDADGVHLGQEDMAPRRARQILGPEKIIGISTHSFKQALRANKSQVDYFACGPIFKTLTKPWRRAVGIDLLRRVVNIAHKPVIAIGGITKENIKLVKRTGVKQVAVINAALDLL
ncbi:MAG: thiamine phosphate synthase [Candidatus Margulisiibacteriota bacterium]